MTGNQLSLYEKHGQKMIGAWQTTIGVYDEVTHLYAYENMADMERIRREVREDPAWEEYMKTPPLLGFEISKLMTPLPYSPLQ